MTINDQKGSPDIRFPEIDSIKDIEGVKQWMRQLRHEWETGHRETWRDMNNVYKVELPAVGGGGTIDFVFPLISGVIFSLSGSNGIKWTAGTVNYDGVVYNIDAGDVDPATAVYLDVSSLVSPITLGTLDGAAVIAVDRWYLSNRAGSDVHNVLQSSIMHAALLQAGTVTATQIAADTITANEIAANTITVNEIAFTVVDETSVIGTINASTEGINIEADNLNISASTTFSSGYDPIDKLDLEGGRYESASSGARVLIFPDNNTGIQVIDNASNDVFKVVVGGTDVGDVIIGDHSGGEGLKYDKSLGTFDLLGTSLTFDGGVLGSATDFFNIGTGTIELKHPSENHYLLLEGGGVSISTASGGGGTKLYDLDFFNDGLNDGISANFNGTASLISGMDFSYIGSDKAGIFIGGGDHGDQPFFGGFKVQACFFSDVQIAETGMMSFKDSYVQAYSGGAHKKLAFLEDVGGGGGGVATGTYSGNGTSSNLIALAAGFNPSSILVRRNDGTSNFVMGDTIGATNSGNQSISASISGPDWVITTSNASVNASGTNNYTWIAFQ